MNSQMMSQMKRFQFTSPAISHFGEHAAINPSTAGKPYPVVHQLSFSRSQMHKTNTKNLSLEPCFRHDFSGAHVHSCIPKTSVISSGYISDHYFMSTPSDGRQEIPANTNAEQHSPKPSPFYYQIMGIPAKKQTTKHNEVQISETDGPEAAQPCSPWQKQRLQPVMEKARSMAHKAFFTLQAHLIGNLPRNDVEQQLHNHFHVGAKSDKSEKVLDIFHDVYTRLSGTPQFASTSPKDRNCEQFGAYVAKTYREIFLCPSFFRELNMADHESPWVILHETAHLSGAGADHAYFFSFGGPPSCNALSPLTTGAAIENADSYAYFAYCVSRSGGK